jgi:hypothetical protein
MLPVTAELQYHNELYSHLSVGIATKMGIIDKDTEEHKAADPPEVCPVPPER